MSASMNVVVAERPAARPAGEYHFPAIERRVVAGLDVVAAHLPGRALASIAVLVRNGMAHEPIDCAGISQLTARLLAEGTTTRNAEEWALAVEARGVGLGTGVSWNTVRLNLTGPVYQLTDASSLLGESFLSPRLDPDDIVRLRTERVESLRMQWARPGTRGNAAFRRILYGADSRYGWTDSGTPQSNAGIDPDQLREIHRAWVSSAATLVIAGDLDMLDVDTIAARLTAEGLRSEPAQVIPHDEPAERVVVLIDRPGAAQSSVLLGHRGPRRANPDYAAITTTGAVLGGSFNSRLNRRLREETGVAYGAQASFDMGRYSGELRAGSEVRTDATSSAVLDAVEEIRRLHADGVGAGEARDALAYQIGVFAASLETPNAIAGALTTIVNHDLPDDYHARLRAELATLTKADLDAAAQYYLDPSRLNIVIEGDLAVFGDEIEAAGLGEVRVLDTDALTGIEP
jgi:zinc protease